MTAEETVARIEGLQSALGVASDRLDRVAVAEAEAVLRRSRERLRLSAGHTVVTLAGATGSGKSSLFNALTGLDLAGVGAKRPTTSWATACAWDPLGAADLLDWLGVPARHQVSRLSMLDTTAEDNELRGLVLLDLPDHDSTEVAHHLEVDRLVQHADLLVWVLDPQKYADAALHERYLRPYAGHSDVMLIVLNQVDRLDEVERARTIADVRQLLDDDGLPDVALLAVSATEGIGITELKALLIQQLKQKQVARERVAAVVSAVAGRLAAAGGDAARDSRKPDADAARELLVDECTVASGAD
ncbi:MAG: 50S ribosome-binding GTPase, partial [Actinomycetota bacterium]|nr:50S ribosome-binding GTPase [Actinomycetota bacterium]